MRWRFYGSHRFEALRIDYSKVVDYLLSPEKSRGKAAFFLRMGFDPEQWEDLAHALKSQVRSGEISGAVESPYGTRYSVDGVMETPGSRSPGPRIRTVWISEHGADEWRLITAYPL